MIQVKVNFPFFPTSKTFKAETTEQAKEMQSKLYNAFANNGCWMPLDRIEIINP